MIDYVISLVVAFLPMFEYALWHIFALCFLAAVPSILLSFFRK